MPSLVDQNRDIVSDRFIRSLGGVALYLPFWKREGPVFIDDSAFGHECTNVGSTKGANSRYFDGVDDLVNCGTSDIINSITGDLTLLSWAFPNTITGDQTLIGHREGFTDNQQPYNLWVSGANTEFRMGNSAAQFVGRSAGVKANEWQLIGGTIENVTLKGFLNGTIGATQGTFSGARQTGGTITIGMSDVGTSRPWDGQIGGAWMFNYALSTQAICEFYLLTKWRYR